MKKEVQNKASLLGLLLSIIYFFILFLTSPIPFEDIKSSNIVCFILKMSKASGIAAVTFSAFLLSAFFLTKKIKEFFEVIILPQIILEFINEDENYSLKDGFRDTLYWIKNIIELVMSIFIPGAIALAFFDKTGKFEIIEGLTNYIIICLLPTMCVLKLREYSAIFFEAFIFLKLIFLLGCNVTIKIIKIFWKLIKKVYNFFLDFIQKF